MRAQLTVIANPDSEPSSDILEQPCVPSSGYSQMDSDASARGGTALFNSPTQTNGIVAVSPAAYISRAGMEATSTMGTGSARSRHDDKLIDSA
jgi:hypothetical protein